MAVAVKGRMFFSTRVLCRVFLDKVSWNRRSDGVQSILNMPGWAVEVQDHVLPLQTLQWSLDETSQPLLKA